MVNVASLINIMREFVKFVAKNLVIKWYTVQPNI